jgi:hypothetical protein
MQIFNSFFSQIFQKFLSLMALLPKPRPIAKAAFLAFLSLALVLLTSKVSIAQCEETARSSMVALSEAQERYEVTDPFETSTEAAQAWDNCLAALNDYALVFGVSLAPLPDFSEITQNLCREARYRVINKIPGSWPSMGAFTGNKKALTNPKLADDLAKALK